MPFKGLTLSEINPVKTAVCIELWASGLIKAGWSLPPRGELCSQRGIASGNIIPFS
jgi:hypothetical protein